MSVLDGLLQGIIQGLTEFLPVSSSGHLSLYQYITGNSGENSLFFSLMLHLGTLAAVIAAYYEELWLMLKEVGVIFKEIFAGGFTLKPKNPQRKMLYMLFVACLPMLAILPLRGFVAQVTGDRDIVIEGVCFLLTSLFLFVGCKAKPGKASIGRMKARHAISIGVFQALAVMPGISRSGATTSAGLFLGFDRSFVVTFSFLLGIPSILGGVVFEIGDAVAQGVQVPLVPLFTGMLAAAVVGYLSIVLIRWLVMGNRYIIFAWYTLVLGVVVIIAGALGHLLSGGAAPDSQAASSLSQLASDVSQAVSSAA